MQKLIKILMVCALVFTMIPAMPASAATVSSTLPLINTPKATMNANLGDVWELTVTYVKIGVPYTMYSPSAMKMDVYERVSLNNYQYVTTVESNKLIIPETTSSSYRIMIHPATSGTHTFYAYQSFDFSGNHEVVAGSGTYIVELQEGIAINLSQTLPGSIRIYNLDLILLQQSVCPSHIDNAPSPVTCAKDYVPSFNFTPPYSGFYLINTSRGSSGPLQYYVNVSSGFSGMAIAERLREEEYQKRNGQSIVSDPVDAATGAQFMDKTVLNVNGVRNIPLTLKYHSLTDYYGSLGRRWAHNYMSKISVISSSEIQVWYDGSGYTKYLLESTNLFKPSGTSHPGSAVVKNTNGTYTATLRDGTTYQFSAAGRLTSQTNKVGQQLQFTYDSNNRLSKVLEPISQNFISFAYNGSSTRLTEASDNYGRKVFFSVNSTTNNLTSITDTENLVTNYTYNNVGQILTATDPESNIIFTNEFDGLFRIKNQKDALNNITHFEYDDLSEPGVLITRVTDRNNVLSTLRHNQSFELTSKTDALGRVTEYTYTDSHKPHTITTPLDETITYEYDGYDNILSITEPMDKKTENTYDNKNNILTTSIKDTYTDTTLSQTTFSYDSSNRIESSSDTEGTLAGFTYNNNSQLLAKTDALGQIFTYTYNGWKLVKEEGPLGHEIEYTYDTKDRVATKKDSLDNVTSFTYNNKDMVLTTVNPDTATTTFTYNSHGDVLTSTDALGYTKNYTYNGNGKVTSVYDSSIVDHTYTYDGEDRILTDTDAEGETTTFTYDSVGNVDTQTNAKGEVTSFTYDDNNRIKTRQLPSGLITTYTYDTLGRVTEESNNLGQEVSYSYDLLGRILTSTDPNGSTSLFTYDSRGNTLTSTDSLGKTETFTYNNAGHILTSTDKNNNVETYTYDALGRLKTTTDSLTGVVTNHYDTNSNLTLIEDQQNNTTTFTYDDVNRLVGVEDALGNLSSTTFDLNGRVKTLIDSKNNVISTNIYDLRGNKTSESNALNQVFSYTHDALGNVLSSTDPLNRTTNFMYDALSRIAKTTDAASGITDVTYDSTGQVSSYTDPNGNMTTYTHDMLGRTLTETDATGYTKTYTYDDNGNILTAVGSDGVTSSFGYDDLNRMTSKTDSLGQTTYSYDDNSNLLNVAGTGLPITRQYDALDRLTSYTDSMGNTIEYEYDSVGNLTRLTYPDNKEVTYTYDSVGNMKTVTDWLNNTTTYSYDENNRLILTSRPNGTSEIREYNIQGQLIRLADVGPSGTISDVDFEYDANGNVVIEGLKDYGYDDLDRVNSAANDTFGYDFAGNLTSVSNLVYNNTIGYGLDNRMTMFDSLTLSNDARGNLLDIPTAVGTISGATYNERNQLISFDGNSYTYDAEGNRITSTNTSTGSTTYVNNPHSSLPELLMEEDSLSNKKYYVHGLGLIAEVTDHGEIQYFSYDRRGSTIALTDELGIVTDTFDYSAYGELTRLTGTTETRFLYNGKFGVQTDSNGLYYMQSRYYSPVIKRFINRDVIVGTFVEPQSLNRFAYTNGNPISFIDPFGFSRDTDSIEKYFAQGFFGAAISTGEGLLMSSPLGILIDPKGYWDGQMAYLDAVLHPGRTAKAIWSSVSTDYNTNVVNGTANTRANYLGKVTFGAGALLATRGRSSISAPSSFVKAVPNGSNEYGYVTLGPYGKLKRNKSISGQAHHLNQDAAYKSVIPSKDGISVKLEGNAITDIGSPHYNAHADLEPFWSPYRVGGSKFPTRPTNQDYEDALTNSLQRTGLSTEDITTAVDAARMQRMGMGLAQTDPVPRVPGPLHQTK